MIGFHDVSHVFLAGIIGWTSLLRHVTGFPGIGLLLDICYHAEYSEAELHSQWAFQVRQSTFSH